MVVILQRSSVKKTRCKPSASISFIASVSQMVTKRVHFLSPKENSSEENFLWFCFAISSKVKTSPFFKQDRSSLKLPVLLLELSSFVDLAAGQLANERKQLIIDYACGVFFIFVSFLSLSQFTWEFTTCNQRRRKSNLSLALFALHSQAKEITPGNVF